MTIQSEIELRFRFSGTILRLGCSLCWMRHEFALRNFRTEELTDVYFPPSRSAAGQASALNSNPRAPANIGQSMAIIGGLSVISWGVVILLAAAIRAAL